VAEGPNIGAGGTVPAGFEQVTTTQPDPSTTAGVSVIEAPKDPRANAVELKLFGPLTRRSYEWHPVSLMCKRFDVPDPYPKSGLVGVVGLPTGSLQRFSAGAPPPSASAGGGGGGGGGGQVVQVCPEDYGISGDAMDTTPSMSEVLPRGATNKPNDARGGGGGGGGGGGQGGSGTINAADDERGATESENSNPEAAEGSARPPMDIFKAIFSDSSDDDSEGDGEGDSTSAVRGTVLPAVAPALPAPYFPDAMDAGEGAGIVAGSVQQRAVPHATAPSPPSTRRPAAVADAGPKLSLVHTYDELTSDQSRRRGDDVRGRAAAAADVPTAVWVEKRAIESTTRARGKGEEKRQEKGQEEERQKK